MLNEASAEEKHEITQWLNNRDSNIAYYNELKKVWDTSRELASQSTVDENKAWEKFSGLIRREEAKQVSRRIGFTRIKIAASVILLVGLGLTANLLFNRPVKEIVVQTLQNPITDTLPDGSVITINKGSSISYPSGFKEKSRSLTLKGEAFFHITPDRKRPFIITVNDVQVMVVGTSFNVKNADGNTEVIVESGIVRVSKAGNMIDLRANEKLKVEANSTVFVKERVNDRLYNYYRTKEFVCDDTPLWRLVEVVNEAYHTHIAFGNTALKDLKLNTTFNNESLDQVLNVISLTFDIRINKEGDRIILQ